MECSGTTVCRLMKSSDVFDFWKAYTDMLPEIKEKTWIALEIGLGQYLQVMKMDNLNHQILNFIVCGKRCLNNFFFPYIRY